MTPPVTPPVTPVVPVTPAKPPTISLTKKARATTVAAGSTVNYQLVVKATGGTAQNVVVCDQLPANMTYVSLGTATMNNGRACWDVGDLTGSLTLSLTAKVDVGRVRRHADQQRHGDLEQRGQRQGPREHQGAEEQARREGQAQAHRRRDRLATHRT